MKFKAKYRPELICSKDVTRRAITEPHVGKVRGKVCLTATDGRRLLVIPVDAEPSEFGTLPKDALSLARSKREDKKQEVVSIGVNGCITLANGWTLPKPNQEEFKYPNVENVIPEKSRNHQVSFNAKLLYQLAQSMGVEQVILNFQDSMSAILVSSPGDEAYGVLMPMRFEPL
jgi:DNA polymerase III sliding clamp (beta) subunit (PCNA family)